MNSKVLVWDLPVRVFHWSLALAFVGAYSLGESERWRDLHVALGYVAIGLICFRLVWGFAGTRYARFRSFAYTPTEAWRYFADLLRGRATHFTGHNPAGSWAIYGLLVLGLATGVSGWLRYAQIGGDALESLHEFFANAWLGLVVAHIAAVLATSALHRENLPRTMLTGYKRAAAGDGVPGARGGTGVLLAAAALALGWTAWAGGRHRAPDAPQSAHSEMAGRRAVGDD